MYVMIPTRDCANYNDDHNKMYKYGGKWNIKHNCYYFEQQDIEAVIECQSGNWTDITEQEERMNDGSKRIKYATDRAQL